MEETTITKSYTIKISSEQAKIADLDNFLELLLEEYEVSDEYYGKIMTSMNEAVTNAIVHGNKNIKEKKVLIHTQIAKGQKAVFKVSNEGDGFDYNNVPNPTLPENMHKYCGRGIFIMKGLADKCIFNEKGTEVELHFLFN